MLKPYKEKLEKELLFIEDKTNYFIEKGFERLIPDIFITKRTQIIGSLSIIEAIESLKEQASGPSIDKLTESGR